MPDPLNKTSKSVSNSNDIDDSRRRSYPLGDHVSFRSIPYIDDENGHRRDHHRNFDINLYATKKSAAQGLLDLALLMANASQLKHIILTDGDHRFYTAMIVLLSTSIGIQIAVAIGLLFLARIRIYDYQVHRKAVDKEIEETDDLTQKRELEIEERWAEKKLRQADLLNNLIVAGIFILTVINVFISAFGLNESPKKENGSVQG